MTPAPTPEAVAKSYLTALGNRDWEAAAALVDEDVVTRTLAAFLTVSQGGEENTAPTHGDDAFIHVFRGVGSRSELSGMPAAMAYARLMATFGTGSYAAAGPRQLDRIVGSIVHDDIAHVVYYSKWEHETKSLPWVLVLRHGRHGWAALPTGTALEPAPETLFADPLRLDW